MRQTLQIMNIIHVIMNTIQNLDNMLSIKFSLCSFITINNTMQEIVPTKLIPKKIFKMIVTILLNINIHPILM
ncbi:MULTISPECIES: hypothetical protein [Clostridium]|uniref:hypothetical protein n=1 Tax=Clostridium TaxID=1485 RepID=UPI00077D8E47|nr:MULTISPECIES: hypothetical protein [Clostridium]MBE6045009.1 hypothetical protein [Clostridium thermopalmarium]